MRLRSGGRAAGDAKHSTDSDGHTPWLRFVLLACMAVAGCWFAGQRLATGITSLDSATLAGNAPIIALALVALSGGTLLLGLAWMVVLEGVAGDLPKRRTALMTAFLIAWLGRYVPGTVPFFAGKIYLGRRAGYETSSLVVSTALENVLEVIVATLFGATMILISRGPSGGVYVLPVVAASIGLVAIHPAVLRPLTMRLMRRLKRDPMPALALPAVRTIVLAAALILGNQVVNGLALLALLHVLAGSGWNDTALIAGAASLAGVFGMLIVLAPAGLGFRDGAFVALLSSRVGVSAATVATILARSLTVVSDVMLALVALAYDRASGAGITAGARSVAPVDLPSANAVRALPEERAA